MSADRRTRLTRGSFRRLLPMVRPQPLTVLPTRIWTDEEWERIQLGCKARTMDEKWHVLTEGDTVHLHRSWTGHAIYQATFSPAEGGGRLITAGCLETDPRRHRHIEHPGGHEYHSVLLELLLSTVVLEQDPEELRARWTRLQAAWRGDDAPAGAAAHSALGTR